MRSETEFLLAQGRKTYANLSARQQHIVWAVLLCVAILIVTMLVLQPALTWYQEQYQHWRAVEDDYMWLESQQPRAALLAQYRKQGSSGQVPLLSLVTASAKAHTLTINRYEPRDDNELAFWMEQVPYAAVMPWLRHLLAQDAAMRIRELSLRATDQPGFVAVSIELTR